MAKKVKTTMGKEPQKKMIMAVVAWLGGAFGIHLLMMGHKNWWWRPAAFFASLFTCCLPVYLVICFWPLYDIYLILTGQMKMADGRDLLE